MSFKPTTVYVAMSGGVDSSVAANLLKRQGFWVVGVFMKPWQAPGMRCLWEKDREDAMRVAAVLNIPLKTWDFSAEYGRLVTKYMIDTYHLGNTPNPDVMCNKEIKFGLFHKKALAEGADFIATGHYARVSDERLFTARDTNKDQTYFLWTLTREILAKTLFPLGDLTKPEVRKLAKKFKLPVHDKKDSQGVCFIGPLNMKDFLKTQIQQKPGNILDSGGRILGRHDGVYYYTIGQRHGLNITLGGGPYFVISKNVRKNTITVGSEKDLFTQAATLENFHFIYEKQIFPMKLSARIRYRTKVEGAILHENGQLVFSKPQRAITPGQSAVFYKKTEVLGGGIIK